MRGAIFDLDGVLVDTARYHYLAWKSLAGKLNIDFNETDNERLKGISRMNSLNVLLSLSQEQNEYSIAEKERLADEKNNIYVNYINSIDQSVLLPGAIEVLENLKKLNVLISLGSASKNSISVLRKTGIYDYFDAIVDGNSVSKAKPNPEVFLAGAKRLNLRPEECLVFEDAEAGCQAAKSANMKVIGIGDKGQLIEADEIISSLVDFDVSKWFFVD